MVVLSLFDGISCGRVALERAGVHVDKYIASEIKPFAIKVAKENYPDTIEVGDVTKLSYDKEAGVLHTEDGDLEVGPIDMVIGGSPCQDFSALKGYMGKDRAYGLEGTKSRLFYEYLRLLKEVSPKYFLLENVHMKADSEKQLNEYLGVEGIHINSSLVSFQNRPRIYWTNIPGVTPPEDRGILFTDHQCEDWPELEEAAVHRTPSRITMWNGGLPGKFACKNITNEPKIGCLTRKQDRFPNSGLVAYKDFCRFLTRSELEAAQTLPRGYTGSLSLTQVEDVCGDGWTVDVIAHIFSTLPELTGVGEPLPSILTEARHEAEDNAVAETENTPTPVLLSNGNAEEEAHDRVSNIIKKERTMRTRPTNYNISFTPAPSFPVEVEASVASEWSDFFSNFPNAGKLAGIALQRFMEDCKEGRVKLSYNVTFGSEEETA